MASLSIQGKIKDDIISGNEVLIHKLLSRTYLSRGVFISGCWIKGITLYTEVSSFKEVGIEGFHCIQRCLHFRVLEQIRGVTLYIEVSVIYIYSRCSTAYKGVLITGGWNRGVLLYTEVSLFQEAGTEEFHIQRCPHFRRLE